MMLKEMAKYLTARKEEFYRVSLATGAGKADAWIDIDGGIGTFFVYQFLFRRSELPVMIMRVISLPRISRARPAPALPPQTATNQIPCSGKESCSPPPSAATPSTAAK